MYYQTEVPSLSGLGPGWQVGGGGVGVGQDGGCDVPCTCTWIDQEELLLQPAPSKESTSFTNHLFY